MKATGQPGPEIAGLKITGTETGRNVRDIGLEALGAAGMLWGDDVPDGGLFHRYAMFTPAQSIAGGTDEVLRNSIESECSDCHASPTRPSVEKRRGRISAAAEHRLTGGLSRRFGRAGCRLAGPVRSGPGPPSPGRDSQRSTEARRRRRGRCRVRPDRASA